MDIPYDILKILSHRIINGDILDGKDYEIYIKYKKIINLIIDKIKYENNR
jgi:hypothetical protein